MIVEAVGKAGYELGKQVFIALDPAASEFYDADREDLLARRQADSTGRRWSTSTPPGSKSIPICSIEDGFAEDDWDGWKLLTDRLGKQDPDRSATTCSSPTPSGCSGASTEGVANSILIKVNQIGTLTETIEAVDLARRNGYTAVISHRSGETEDATIADLAVALGTGQIKTGSASRTDRMAKYNQLLRIEEMLGEPALYGGPLFRKRSEGRD